MRNAKSFVYALLGVLLAAMTVLLSFWGRDAAPRLVQVPEGAVQCSQALLDSVCAGDYAGASQYLYGSPRLDAGQLPQTDSGSMIWDAFVESLSYELVGECYATTNGVAQRVSVTAMQIPAVADSLKEQAQILLEQRVDAAQDMDEIYDDNLEYRQDFLQSVLRDAAAQCVAANGQPLTQELELNLVYDRGQWWVVPDPALLSAISGGIL